ncbi:hypothetical protein PZE06_12885 [Robertmurraya sp. DFI.2.37]|uniref:hypothetical protein n=1 Tax=Robertmurraya sp. DFI.2.37 TaxID=3031819 RepID=UPI0012450576|nr:hypothetical protein [Robertmurraya sp. DFI.2.37]MDF1509066.1 hypothetical protein [Robertmurraya sp. DFI.2.37]
MKADYEGQLKEVNDIAKEKVSKTYATMNELFSDQSLYVNSVFSEEELQLFATTSLFEMYYVNSLHIDENFQQLDPIAFAEMEIRKYGLSGGAAQLIRSQYARFSERYADVLQNKEYKHLFPAQNELGTHELLFKTVFKVFLLEGVILTVLVTAHVMNFEFERGTYLLTYATRRGRALAVDKIWAALMANLILFALILTTGLVLYFKLFSYKEFWQVPISSLFNAGQNWFMSWWNFTFLQYLLATVLLAILLIILFTFITVILARWIRNSYLVFFIFFSLFGSIFAIQGLFSSEQVALILSFFTPVNLVLNSFIWFMYQPLTVSAYFEVITVGAWLLLVLAITFICQKSFQKCDLK